MHRPSTLLTARLRPLALLAPLQLLFLAPGCGPLAGQRPCLALDAEALHLPAVAEGLSASAELTLYNLGATELRISHLRLEPTISAWSLDGPTTAFGIGADGAQVLTVRRTASLAAPRQARLLLESNDPDRPAVTVMLDAPGSSANLGASPARLDFGAVKSGQTGVNSVRIVNLGTAAARALELVWSGQDATGDFGATLPLDTLAPAGTLVLQVSYSPRGGGSDQATLTLRWQEGEAAPGSGQVAYGSLALPLSGQQDLKAPD